MYLQLFPQDLWTGTLKSMHRKFSHRQGFLKTASKIYVDNPLKCGFGVYKIQDLFFQPINK